MDIKEAGLIAGDIRDHWYYAAKLAAVRRLIRDLSPVSILDVGAGLGFFAEALLADTGAAEAVCVDPGYPQDSQREVAGKPLRFCRTIGPGCMADLVLMMDVLEHVPDDRALVAEYAARVRPGTRFVFSVPAFMWLWSGHDVFLEHHRRYTLGQIETAVAEGGLRVEIGCYFYGALLPLVAASRLGAKAVAKLRGVAEEEPRSQMRAFGALSNAAFKSACDAELSVMTRNRLGGSTAFVRAVKP